MDLGVNCIEHFYGVGDAALDGIQDFPPEHNSNNEIHRFGRAGEPYTQNSYNPAKMSQLLDDMVAKHAAWSPTMSTCEGARDFIKAQNLPWYKDYLYLDVLHGRQGALGTAASVGAIEDAAEWGPFHRSLGGERDEPKLYA